MLRLVGGLIVMTRPTNALFAIFVLGHWLAVSGSLREAVKRLARRAPHLAAAAAAALLPLAVQMAYWKAASGRFWLYAYGDEKFDFLRPKLFAVLLSVEKGTFVYVPLGLGISKTTVFNGRPMTLGVQYYYNVERPDGVAATQLRFVVALLYPVSKK